MGEQEGGEGEGEEGKGALMPACLVSKTVTCRPPASAVPIVLPTSRPEAGKTRGRGEARAGESILAACFESEHEGPAARGPTRTRR